MQPSYAVSTNGSPGPLTKLGDPVPIPDGWVDSSKAMAVGVISTSFGGAPPFPATWDFIEVVRGAPDTTPGAPTVAAYDTAAGGDGGSHRRQRGGHLLQAMDASTIKANTFTLTEQGSNHACGRSGELRRSEQEGHPQPQRGLSTECGREGGRDLHATVKGGAGGAKDLAGNLLASDKSWSFSTAVPPGDGQWQTRAASPTNRQEVSYVQSGWKFYLAGGHRHAARALRPGDQLLVDGCTAASPAQTRPHPGRGAGRATSTTSVGY